MIVLCKEFRNFLPRLVGSLAPNAEYVFLTSLSCG